MDEILCEWHRFSLFLPFLAGAIHMGPDTEDKTSLHASHSWRTNVTDFEETQSCCAGHERHQVVKANARRYETARRVPKCILEPSEKEGTWCHDM